MAAGLLETKLHRPRPRRTLVPRPRLGGRLSRGAEAAVTLVSAPAGFGKTTLLADWLSGPVGDARSTAWLWLDQRDNDPVQFWSYLIAALQTAAPAVGAGAVLILQTPQSPLEDALTSLLNDLGGLPLELVLVLDDYHVIEDRDIHNQMTFLLDHAPPQLHVVIATRTDPPLPLARLRARGELVEIRAVDLRFGPDEAAAYLNDVMGLKLTVRDVTALAGRTEGWIAALQLAALSLQGRDDGAEFIAGFAGDDRYIVDYLAQEVLERQPEPIRHFLLQTSILDRLTGLLCDAITGRDDGTAQLAQLERGNLFLAPLDDQRRWYRYHQLFADVLQARLHEEFPRDVAELHDRASRWLENNDAPADAISHALAAGNFDRLADLVELAIPGTRTSRREAELLGWLRTIPDEVLRARPILSVEYAGTLLASGIQDGVEVRLRDAELWLTANTGAGPWPGYLSSNADILDSEALRRLPATIEVHRAGHALTLGDPVATVGHARRALDLAPDDDDVNRAAAAALLGLTLWGSGNLEAAHAAYTECTVRLRRAGYIADTLGCAIVLADIRLTQGRLGDALHTYQQALRDATEPGGQVLRGTPDMHVGLSEIYRQRGNLAAAAQHLTQSQQLGDHLGLPQNRYRWRVAMARLRQAGGDLDGALDLLNEADHLYVGDFSPNVRPVSAMLARLRIVRGEWAAAARWAHERALSARDDLSYLREFEHVTWARILLARHSAQHDDSSLEDAIRLLARLRKEAEAGQRIGSVIEISILQSIAQQTHGQVEAALAALEHALVLAEPEGYLRMFVDEGRPMASLLRTATKCGIVPGYTRRLLAALEHTEKPATLQEGMTEPLSERELDVLRLLATDLGGPHIARTLSVSLTTVRTHTRHIYTKLGVNNRRACVRRARELHLLPPGNH